MKKLLLFSIAFWGTHSANSQTWSALGSGMNQTVNCLAEYSNSLYAGGDFTYVNGTTTSAHYIAKWDGSSWSPLGSALNNTVSAMTSYNNELYVGGNFTTAGGNSANYIAKWNGTSWSSVGTGLNQRVYSMAVYNGALYVGGNFTTAGGNSANYIAKWNGSTWSSLGSGVNGSTYHTVLAMTVYNSELVIGGMFNNADGNAVQNLTKWDGTIFSAINGVSNGTSPNVPAVACLSTNNTTLYEGGSFLNSNGITVNNLVHYSGGASTSIGGGVAGTNHSVQSLAVYNGDLYVGGWFSYGVNGPVSANNIIKWNGTSWSALGNGITGGSSPVVMTLLVYNYALYIGGSFTTAGTTSAKNIAKWSLGSVGIEETQEQNAITLYPNPFSSQTTISFTTEQKNCKIKKVDILGKEVKTIYFNGKELMIEKEEMKEGIYFVQIIDEKNNIVNKKIIIQ